jgi:hypothetical protein
MVLCHQDRHLRWSRVGLYCGALLLPAPALVVIRPVPQVSIAGHGYCHAVVSPSLSRKASAAIEIELWPAPLLLGCCRIRTPRCRICPRSFIAQVSMLQFVVGGDILGTRPIAPLFPFLPVTWQCSSCAAPIIVCLATDCASPGLGHHLTRHPFGCYRIHPQSWALRVPFG